MWALTGQGQTNKRILSRPQKNMGSKPFITSFLQEAKHPDISAGWNWNTFVLTCLFLTG